MDSIIGAHVKSVVAWISSSSGFHILPNLELKLSGTIHFVLDRWPLSWGTSVGLGSQGDEPEVQLLHLNWLESWSHITSF